MKPDSSTAMQQLIEHVRVDFPFDLPVAQVCNGECRGCSIKLLDFLGAEIDAWDARLAAGERVGLAELSRLLRTVRKVGQALKRSGLPIGPLRQPL